MTTQQSRGVVCRVLSGRSRLILSLLAIALPAFVMPASSAQQDDSREIVAVVQKFFVAYQGKDLTEIMALWKEKSPEAAGARQMLEKTFSAVKTIEVKNLNVVKVEKSDSQTAVVRLVAEIIANDASTGKPAKGFGRLNRVVQLIYDSGVWRIERYLSGEEDLAHQIGAAKTEEERKALVAANQELMTADLDNALVAEGRRLMRQSNYLVALDICRLGQDIAKQINDEAGSAGALLGIGTTYWYMGNYPKARESLDSCLNTFTRLGDKGGIARTLNGIGLVLWRQGDYAGAVDYYTRSLKIEEEVGDSDGLRRVLGNLGAVTSDQANYGAALEYQRRSLTLSQAANDEYSIALTLNNMGITLGKQGDYRKALECFEGSLKAAEAIGARQPEALALNDMGIVQRKLGNFEQALAQFQASSKLMEEVGDKSGIAGPLGDIGNTYADRGDYTKAFDYLHRSLDASQSTGNKPQMADVLTSLGSIEKEQGHYAKAIEYIKRSLKLSEETGDMYAVADALGGLGEVYYTQGEYQLAVEAEGRSLAIAKQIGSPDLNASALTAAGYCYHALGKPDQARLAFSDAVAAIEKVRNLVGGPEGGRQRFLESRIAPYYGMAELLAEQGDATQALAFAERARARTLLDVLLSGKVDITRAMTAEENSREQGIKSELASLNSQIVKEKMGRQPDEGRLTALQARIDKARLDYDGFQTSLYASHPELKVQRGQFQAITLKECGGLFANAGSAILEFLVSPNRTTVFVLTPKKSRGDLPDLKAYKININEKDLADLTDRFRERLAKRDMTYGEMATKLYDLLLGPVAAGLSGKSDLIIVPDGVLWDLPFQALQSRPDHFLIEDAAVSYAPSLTALREMTRLTRQSSRTGGQKALPARKSSLAQNTMLALGNPVLRPDASAQVKGALMDAELGPLPQAEAQVRAIGRLYGATRSKVYVGPDATEDRLKSEAAACRILHIAGHAIVNDSNPMYSQILLSRGESSDDDGLLEAWEIINLDLHADLVVLSACETARGRVGAGEGMVGLSWAFFVAGCPSTVVSQWSVDADSTTELMVEFHRNLLAGLGKAKALRKAELKLLKNQQYSAPFYWAPFVIVGDGR